MDMDLFVQKDRLGIKSIQGDSLECYNVSIFCFFSIITFH